MASRPSKRTPAPLMPAADSAACARSVSVPSICGADQSSVSPASTAGTTTAAAISGSHGGRMERSRPVGPVPPAAAPVEPASVATEVLASSRDRGFRPRRNPAMITQGSHGAVTDRTRLATHTAERRRAATPVRPTRARAEDSPTTDVPGGAHDRQHPARRHRHRRGTGDRRRDRPAARRRRARGRGVGPRRGRLRGRRRRGRGRRGSRAGRRRRRGGRRAGRDRRRAGGRRASAPPPCWSTTPASPATTCCSR